MSLEEDDDSISKQASASQKETLSVIIREDAEMKEKQSDHFLLG